MLNNFYVLSPCLPYLDLLLLLYYETISYTGCIVWPRQVNRMTVWRINVKGEPPPQFTWWKDGQYSTFTFSRYPELCRLFHFHFLKITRVFFQLFTLTFSRYPHCRFAGRKIETSDDYQVETQEYQGGATAILQILKTQVNSLSFARPFGMEL